MPYRRPAPPIVVSAVAATVLLLPWAVGTGPGQRDAAPRTADDTELVERPLPALGAGESVREITQDTPFSLVALTGADLTNTSARVRAQHADGSWGPWYETEELESAASSGPSPRGTTPVFVGRTTTVQIAVTRPAGVPDTASSPPSDQPAQSGLGYRPATVEQPFAQGVSAVLISPPRSPIDGQGTLPAAVTAPGQPPHIIGRTQWGAEDADRCFRPADGGVRAAVVHHTAGSNAYAPEDSAEIVRAIYAYHTQTLGWCDIGYNALVDKYGQVFEGRAGGITNPVEGDHSGGFNRSTWGVAMLGNFDDEPPTPIQRRNVGRLLGWRLGLDAADPQGTAVLTSAGGPYTHFPRGATPTLPTIFTHRDVGNTDCPGNAGYAALDEIRDIAARFNEPPGPADLARALEGGAIHARWQQLGGEHSALGMPASPEAAAAESARYVTFDHGAIYWSPVSGAQPVTGAIYDAWASLGYERGALGLPTSGQIQEPQWVVQYFQHGTLNLDREAGTVTRVHDGVAQELPPPAPDGPPVQLERFTPPVDPAA